MKLLTGDQKRALSAKAHALKPVVLMGQHGLTPSVLSEIERALHDHELIKVRLTGSDRESKHTLAEEIASQTQSTVIHVRGYLLTLYLPRPKES
jgi:RNA-binding protein